MTAVATLQATQARTDQVKAIARDARRERTRMLGLIVPALVILAVVLLTPLGWLMWQSVIGPEGLTAMHYRRILDDVGYHNSFWLTFEISGLVTILAILIGYPLSYMLSRLKPIWAGVGIGLVIIPFWTSLLVRTYAWMLLLQRKGLINDALVDLGIVEKPLALMHNFTGTTIGMLHIMLPFMVLPLYATMRRIDGELLLAAANLGASPRYAFWRVFFPLSKPGLMAGTLLVFVLCLGFYITPELLGGGRTIMISMLIARNVELYFEWGAASSVAIVVLVLVLAVFWLFSRVLAVERVFGAR